MKISMFCIVSIVFLTMVTSCSKNEARSDAVQLSDTAVAITGSAAENLKDAASVESAVTVIESYTSDMNKVSTRAKAFRQKFPDYDLKTNSDIFEQRSAIRNSRVSFAMAFTDVLKKYGTTDEFVSASRKLQAAQKEMQEYFQ